MLIAGYRPFTHPNPILKFQSEFISLDELPWTCMNLSLFTEVAIEDVNPVETFDDDTPVIDLTATTSDDGRPHLIELISHFHQLYSPYVKYMMDGGFSLTLSEYRGLDRPLPHIPVRNVGLRGWFDIDFYSNLYPYLEKILRGRGDLLDHYKNHGQAEGLIPNRVLFKLIRTCLLNRIESYREWIPYELPYEGPTIYVITRTHNRETSYGELVHNIKSQTYRSVRHIVSYDNLNAQRYVQDTEVWKTLNLCSLRGRLHPNLYIDYFYKSIELDENGYVLVLDDDDRLTYHRSLSYMIDVITNTRALCLTWPVHRPDRWIFPNNPKYPQIGEIASCGYLYSTRLIRRGVWKSGGLGDYPFYQYLTSKTTPVAIDIPLTRLSYSDAISGWSAL